MTALSQPSRLPKMPQAGDRTVAQPLAAWRHPGIVALTIGLYLGLDWVTFTPAFSTLGITPWNPANALALAIVLKAGLGYAPLLGIALFLTDVIVRALPLPWTITAIEAILVSLCYSAALWVLLRSRWRIDPALGAIRDLITMIGTVTAAALLVAILYNGVLALYGLQDPERLPAAIVRYWIGDVIGILVVMPFFLLVANGKRWPRFGGEQACQITGILLAVTMVFLVDGHTRLHWFYLLFLPITWVAVRGGLTAVSAGLLIIQVSMMVALHLTADAPQHVPAIQALMTTLAITGLTIGVLIDERERSARHLSLQQDAIARATRAGSLGELATAIAHELNQPLTAANNYSRAMVAAIERHPPDLDAARLTGRKAAEQIGRSASIVVGLRDYIRAGRLETGAHELAGLVDESVALMQPEADRAGVRIEVYIPRTVPKLAVDPLKIEQVLINLIRNALEAIAGSPPADPCITISASRIVEGGVEVVVADNGPGFPPGFRLGNTRPVGSTKIDGLGIGLGFCLSIIESHGGRLELRPAAHGANVRFTLPIADGRYDEP